MDHPYDEQERLDRLYQNFIREGWTANPTSPPEPLLYVNTHQGLRPATYCDLVEMGAAGEKESST